MTKLLRLVQSLLEAVFGNTEAAAARETLAATQRELDRERRITSALRLRIADKEGRIRDLEKLLAQRDPGALLDSVFGGQPPG